MSETVPHDADAERALLGAALMTKEAAELLARQTNPSDFYVPAHSRLRSAIVDLVEAAQPIDPVTVAAQVARSGALDPATTKKLVLQVQASCPSAGNAQAYLKEVRDYGRRRRGLDLSRQLQKAAVDGIAFDGVLAQLEGLQLEQRIDRSTWDHIAQETLIAALAGEHTEDEPSMLGRSDGICLLYDGKIHFFAAEPEAGKSWLALHACAEQIDAGQHVFYLDFEGDPGSCARRLQALGLEQEKILERFHYSRPTTALGPADWALYAGLLGELSPSVVVLDGLTEALSLHGLDMNSNADVAVLSNLILRPIANLGPALVILDHVTKDTTSRGRWAIGAQHKLAVVDGASYGLEVIRPIVRDGDGLVRVVVTKDRPGHVRRSAVGKHVADVITRSDKDMLVIEVRPPAAGLGQGGLFRPTALMEKVSRWLELHPGSTGNEVRKAGLGGKTKYIGQALSVLVTEGWVATQSGDRRSVLHTVVTAYREAEDPSGEVSP